jgi:hypothetical protein
VNNSSKRSFEAFFLLGAAQFPVVNIREHS